MDTYSVSAGTAVGNELAKDAKTRNQFALSQNAVLVGQAQATLAADKSAKTTDTEFKVGMDSYGGLEALGSSYQISQKGISGLAQETIDKFRGSGNKVSNVTGETPDTPSEPSGVGETPPEPDTLDASDFTTSVNQEDSVLPSPAKPSELTGAETTADDVSQGLNDASKGAEGEEDLTGLAKGLTAATGEGSRFGGLSEAGGVGRFLANRAGFTSELGVEVGGKALGGIGGAISAGQDITQFVNTGHIFKPGESGFSEAGNIMSMAGAALDMASIAVPILAPLALATNIGSAIAGTIGTEQDDNNKISTDSKPPQQQQLDTHPAWSAIGMTASVHQPSVV
jgi:hypothetical protein